MKLVRLAHVNVRVPDLEAAVRFYRELLGLEQIFRKDPAGKGAWFRLGDGEVHLTEDAAPQPVSGRHFACAVEGLEELKKRLTAAGRPIEREEGRRFFTRDPAGNRIELIEAFEQGTE